MECLPSIATLLRSQCSEEEELVAGDSSSPPLPEFLLLSFQLTAQDGLLRSVHANTADREIYLQGGHLLKRQTSRKRGEA